MHDWRKKLSCRVLVVDLKGVEMAGSKHELLVLVCSILLKRKLRDLVEMNRYIQGN